MTIEIINADDLVTAFEQTRCAMHTNKASSAGDKRSQLNLQPILIARLNSTKNIIQQKTWRKASSLPITFVNRKEIENVSENS